MVAEALLYNKNSVPTEFIEKRFDMFVIRIPRARELRQVDMILVESNVAVSRSMRAAVNGRVARNQHTCMAGQLPNSWKLFLLKKLDFNSSSSGLG